MRMLLNVRMPHEPFNTLVRKGKIGAVVASAVAFRTVFPPLQRGLQLPHRDVARRIFLLLMSGVCLVTT